MKIILCLSFGISFLLLIAIPQIYGQTEVSSDVGTVSIDADKYEVQMDELTLVKISGIINEGNRNDRVNVVVTMPNGLTNGLSAILAENGNFETFWLLDLESELGTYQLLVSFENAIIGTLSFEVIEKEFSVEELEEARNLPTQQTSETIQEPKLQVEELNEFDLDFTTKISTENVLVRIGKSVNELKNDDELSVHVFGNNKYKRAGQLSLNYIFPDGTNQEKQLGVSDNNSFEDFLNIDDFGSQRGTYSIDVSFESRCPNNIKILCQPVSKRLQGTLSFSVNDSQLSFKTENELESLHDLALNSYESGKFRNAIQEYEKILKYDPQDEVALNRIGLSYQGLDDFEMAEYFYKRALKIEPNYVHPLQNLGNIAFDNGDYIKAHSYFNKALSIEPENVSVLYNRGLVYVEQHNFDAAEKVFAKVLTIDENNFQSLNGLSNVIDKTGNPERALYWINEALSLEPNNVIALSNKGMILNELENYQEALDVFEQALAINPDDTITLFNKAVTLNDMAMHEQALTLYEKVLQIDPSYEDAQVNKQWTIEEMQIIRQQQEESNTQIIAIVGGIVVAGGISAVIVSKKLKSKKASSQEEMIKTKSQPKSDEKWKGI